MTTETLMYQRIQGGWTVTRANTFNVLDNGSLMLTLVTPTGETKSDGFGGTEPVMQQEHVLTIAPGGWIVVCSTAEVLTHGEKNIR